MSFLNELKSTLTARSSDEVKAEAEKKGVSVEELLAEEEKQAEEKEKKAHDLAAKSAPQAKKGNKPPQPFLGELSSFLNTKQPEAETGHLISVKQQASPTGSKPS